MSFESSRDRTNPEAPKESETEQFPDRRTFLIYHKEEDALDTFRLKVEPQKSTEELGPLLRKAVKEMFEDADSGDIAPHLKTHEVTLSDDGQILNVKFTINESGVLAIKGDGIDDNMFMVNLKNKIIEEIKNKFDSIIEIEKASKNTE